MTTILTILVLLLLAYVAVKVVGFLLKAAFVIVIAGVLYWWLAPVLNLPLP
jgi:hypothetical protein